MNEWQRYDAIEIAMSGIERAMTEVSLLKFAAKSDTEYDAYRVTERQLEASWDRLHKRSNIAHRAMK